MHRSGLLVGLAAVLSVAGCLGRTGLTDGELGAEGADGALPGVDGASDTALPGDGGGPGVDSTVPSVDTGAPDTRPPPPDSIDFFDIFPIPDSGPIGACASCVASHCARQVNACLNDPSCRTGLVCTVTKCIAGGGGGGGGGGPGGFDFACILGCFGGDIGKAGEAIAAFTCVLSNCGSTCGGVLGGGDGGLPGGGGPGGGGGGGGGGGDAGSGMSMSSERAWTPQEVQSIDPSTRIGFAAESFDAWDDVRLARCAAAAPR